MKLKLTKALVTSVATSVGLLGASAGVVFGVSAGMYHVNYMNLEDISPRLTAAMTQNCYSQDIKSQWNMYKELNPGAADITEANWKLFHNDGDNVPQPKFSKKGADLKWGTESAESEAKKRWNFATMSIDGSTHSTLDRSFNQSLYNGIINFIQGHDVKGTDLIAESTIRPSTVLGTYTAASFKPSEDNNNGLTSTYKAIASDSTPFRILGLAGFNHVSPLGDLGTASTEHPFVFSSQFKDLQNMLMLLIDGSVANNQAISSVLFRADQPGFLTAIATCMYFYNNLHLYHKGYRDISVASYGGNPIPTVTVYMGGFQRGLEFFNRFVLLSGMLNNEFTIVANADKPLDPTSGELLNYPDLKNLIEYSKYKDEIYEFLNLPVASRTEAKKSAIIAKLYEEYRVRQIQLGAYATHFTGSFASGDAIGITKQYLARGASAIIAVAGPQSLDSAQEIQNQGSDCIVIGVDSAMENGQYQRAHSRKGLEDVAVAKTKKVDGTTVTSQPEQRDSIIKFSAVKDITTVTKKFCDLCVANKNFDIEDSSNPGNPDPNRAICGVGYQTCGNILNGLISISFDGWHPLVQALRHVTNHDGSKSFLNTWPQAAVQYCSVEPGLSLPENVKAGLMDLDKIDTYKPEHVFAQDTDSQGKVTKEYTVEEYYTHIIGILGVLLSSTDYKVNFKGMSVDATIDETGKVTKVEATPDDKATMTVLEWLTKNMYFTC